MECEGVQALFEEGQTAQVDFVNGSVTNIDTGLSLPARTIPPELLRIIDAGGIFPLLEREGCIAPRA
ncbi:MAG: hypothetical protein V4637_18300 [Pseudomonadota bacterium]